MQLLKLGQLAARPRAAAPALSLDHLYWRIYVTASNGTNWHQGGSEWEMALTAGGADQCTGGTPFTSGDESGFEVANLFNNNTSDFHQWGGPTLPKYAGYGFATPKAIRQLRMIPHNGYVDRMPKDFLIQYTDVYSTLLADWTTVYTAVGVTWVWAWQSFTW